MEIDLTTSNSGWISTDVVLAMARLPNLKNVCFDSSRIRRFINNERFSHILPHSCWGYRRINNEQLSLKGLYDQEYIDMWNHYYEQEKLTPENVLLNLLREFTFKCNFTDLCWIAETEELMDPLLFHEYKCRSGLDGDVDDPLMFNSLSDLSDSSSDLSDSSSGSSDSNDGLY